MICAVAWAWNGVVVRQSGGTAEQLLTIGRRVWEPPAFLTLPFMSYFHLKSNITYEAYMKNSHSLLSEIKFRYLSTVHPSHSSFMLERSDGTMSCI